MGCRQAGSHTFEAPSEDAPAYSAVLRWHTPTTPERHIPGRQQVSPLQQDAAPGNKGQATLVYGRANFEDEHDETARSMWSPIDSCGFRLHIRKIMFNQ